MGLTIGADGAVVAGQKHSREEADETLGGNGQDLVSQAQGALAQTMPAAMMQVEGQTPVKRPRGRPRKHPRPEEQQQHIMQQQMQQRQTQDQRIEGQEQRENHGQEQQHGQQHSAQHHTPEQQMRSPSEIPGAPEVASATPDEMVLVEQLQQQQHDDPQAQHVQHQYPHPDGEHEQSTGTLAQSQDVSMSQGPEVEEDGHAMRFFKGLQAQAHGPNGAGHGHRHA